MVDAGRFTPESEPFRWVLDSFAPVRSAWLSGIAAGGYIVGHRDSAPWYERWQVPIQPAGVTELAGEDTVPRAGFAFRVEHWRWHSVTNDSTRERIHLVIDREILIDRPPLPFFIRRGDAHG